MGRIDDIFAKLKAEGRGGLMPFIVGGHPEPGQTEQMILALNAAGADVIEIGIPFSDPIADGPVIAAAMHDALERGATPSSVFEEVRRVRGMVDCGLVAMVSVSIVHALGGPGAFSTLLADAGFDGVIYPDVPLEHSQGLRTAALAAGLSMSLLVAPTTPSQRAVEIAQASTGFVYLIARTGITGERSDAPEIGDAVGRIRAACETPIACGFGISTPEHVAAVVRDADAAIVGSALVRVIENAHDSGTVPAEAAKAFVQSLAGGVSK